MGDEDKTEKKKHVVADGDRMSKIAHEHGYKDYHALYLAQPEKFRKKRPNPEILMPGDEVELPDKIEAKHSTKDKKAQKYEDDTKLPEVRVTLQAAGKPLANKVLTVTADGKILGAVTSDGDGAVKFHVEPDTAKVLLTCSDPPFSIRLRLGELRPATEAGGVEQRLDNLDYRVPIAAASAPAGSKAEKTAKEAHERRIKKAVQRFQEDHKKKADGKVDDDLRKLLVKNHEPT
jgi:hypothetical protein